MDREDIRLALDRSCREMGRDPKTGAPTDGTYRIFELESVATELKKKDLVT
jgi:hypothetical protein